MINFTEEHSLSFNTTKDLSEDFTQFYNIILMKQIVCRLLNIKKFFNDGSLKPDENLIFLIKFIPFAEKRNK